MYSTPPLGRSPSKYCHPVWCGKTRMVGLPDGENTLSICIDSIPACDRRTDRQTDGQTYILPRHSPRYAYGSRGKNWSILLITLKPYAPSLRAMRSSNIDLLTVPRADTSLGLRRFPVAGPRVWNRLPHELRQCNTLSCFKSKLKIYYFRRHMDN